jgi:hypothetical protein
MREPHEATAVKHNSWPVALMVAGVGLMVAAPLVVGVAPAGSLSLWSDADQAALQRASGEFHAVNTALADGSRGTLINSSGEAFDPVAAKALQVAAKAELEKQRARLKAAQSRPAWVLWILRLAGIAAAGVGVWGYLRGGSTPPQAAPPTGGKPVATLPPKLEAIKRRTSS